MNNEISQKNCREVLVCDSKLVNSKDILNFINKPQQYLQREQTTILKNGKSCTLGWTTIDNHNYVVKCYKFKNTFTFLKRCFRTSRAYRSWRNAKQLQKAGIPTPQPIAYRENRFGPLVAGAYLFYQHIDGDTVMDIFKQGGVTEEKMKLADDLIGIFRKLYQHKIIHSDLKAQNFIVSNQKVYLIDLDTMYKQNFSMRYNKRFNKEMKRFLQNWHDIPEIQQMFQHKLSMAGLYG